MKTKETNPTRPGSPTPCKQALRRNTLFIYRSFRGVIFLLCSCKCATFFPFVEKVDMTVIRNSEKAIVLQMNMVKKVQNLGCVL